MGVLRRRHHYWLPALVLTAFTLLLFSSAASAMTSRSSRASSAPSFGVAARHVQPRMEEKEKRATAGDEKRSRGPGSWPPSCRSKCGWCSPCEPVHVPVQPGMIIRLEYYPEAWRCKCGNKLFMP
ncbi:hypothetical protein HN51_029152 [Arachis hypogaea]|uniref:Epidermal patterning factor-like protein n=2 Tax=Arachis TaxID=3817 RepID=A0A445BFW3_ARAHY|nr:EPIDERMAL PATTERNING FACTOR-like protein 5 [Arachis duranensis]XP_025620249.1 EPIDERMAL PATTERNING FACTOR-like protein 5 [Arachis hypogaea]QHO35730.1 EPIDERMAL PATTERNING FACTOR-like protein [Arachis hypogaea]RYR37511.1 hypothetical protein Ahy_A09g042390 [Arachis hypogaea]